MMHRIRILLITFFFIDVVCQITTWEEELILQNNRTLWDLAINLDRLESLSVDFNSSYTLCPKTKKGNVQDYDEVISHSILRPCLSPLNNVLAYNGMSDRSNMKPIRIPKTVVFSKTSDIRNSQFDNTKREMTFTEPFQPLIVGIRNASFTPWGTAYDEKHVYDLKGCANNAWTLVKTIHLETLFASRKVSYKYINGPAIFISRPFPVFAHDMLEVLPQFYTMYPIISMYPETPILLTGGTIFNTSARILFTTKLCGSHADMYLVHTMHILIALLCVLFMLTD